MEDTLVNLNINSKEVIKELVKDNKKFNQLINKLQIARNTVDCDINLIKAIK